jgi:nucleotide-binding universal stress UspA family protein
MAAVLEAARLIQRRFGSYVEGFALRPAVPDYIPIDMVSGLAWHVDESVDDEAVRQAHALFFQFAHRQDVKDVEEGLGGPAFGWRAEAPAGDGFLAGYGRVFDLVVLGRPIAGKAVPSMATLEAVLFEAGRPLLAVPPKTPASIGNVVVIAWNNSTETARSVAFAMPFLLAAERVVVLSIEGWAAPGPSGAELAACLRRDGVKVETQVVPLSRRNPGEVILREAAALGSDLLIKGAYTQSRLRQMIFGGATSHVLSSAEIPVLFAN